MVEILKAVFKDLTFLVLAVTLDKLLFKCQFVHL